jgi:hypothetical protein
MKIASELFIDAKALIDTPEKWWSPRNGGAGKNAKCVGQAIMAVVDHNYDVFDLLRTFERTVLTMNIPSWNDDPVRTHADIMDAFDRAITAEREKEEAP